MLSGARTVVGVQRLGGALRRSAATAAPWGGVVASSFGAAAPATQTAAFRSDERLPSEVDFGQKLRNMPVVMAQTRPATREGEWVCPYPLTCGMEVATRDLLEKNKWDEAEIEREVSQIMSYKKGGGTALNTWRTVEDYQRTPWYQRFRPGDCSTTHFISIECLKILEENLIPPSQRKDPYAHLRKRHYEDQFYSERFSEQSARHIRREELNRVTPGMPEYGNVSRKKFMEFSREYEKRNKSKDRMIRSREVYNAWRAKCASDAPESGKGPRNQQGNQLPTQKNWSPTSWSPPGYSHV